MTSKAISESAEKPAAAPARRRPLLLYGGIAAGVIVVLALALGLGLGLGLKHNNDSTDTDAAVTGVPLPSRGDGKLEDWRLDTSQYILDPKWDVQAPPTTRHYDIVITEGVGWPDGVVRDMLFVNGKFPAPLIEVNRGDRIVANVTNQLKSNATSVHWHGLFQNGTNWFDGTAGVTQCGIPPGKSLVYNFTVPNQSGTYWYHSHYSTQYLDGILGPLVVHDPAEAQMRGVMYDEDRVVLMQDWYHDFSTASLANYLVPDNENVEPVPDNGLINGMNYFNCSLYDSDSGYTCYQNASYAFLDLSSNTRTRLRLINTGAFAEFQVGVDNHTLTVIEADGTLVVPTTPLHRLPVHVAQRYSVILSADQSNATSYWLRASMNAFCMADNALLDPGGTLAVIDYTGRGNTSVGPATGPGGSVDWADAYDVECEDLDPTQLVPLDAAERPPPPMQRMWRLDFAFGEGANQLTLAAVNGTSWRPLPNTTTLQEAAKGGVVTAANASTPAAADGVVSGFGDAQFVLGVGAAGPEVVDILLYSLDEGAHPFHLHGHVFWIIETGTGPFNWTHYQTYLAPSAPLPGQTRPSTADALRRDTTVIRAYGWSVLRFVADNPGLWALHCHIAWHMEAGLLMQFLSGADKLAAVDVPADVTALCAA